MEEPKLVSASFEFEQEGNCVDGGHEIIYIRCESSLGIDNDGGCFYVLKTKQWAFGSVKDLQVLIDRISLTIKNQSK